MASAVKQPMRSYAYSTGPHLFCTPWKGWRLMASATRRSKPRWVTSENAAACPTHVGIQARKAVRPVAVSRNTQHNFAGGIYNQLLLQSLLHCLSNPDNGKSTMWPCKKRLYEQGACAIFRLRSAFIASSGGFVHIRCGDGEGGATKMYR